MHFWKESQHRLRLAGEVLGARLQFLVAAGILAAVLAQTGVSHVWSYPILAPLWLWLAVVLWRGSVWVMLDGTYQMVTVERRRALGFLTISKAVRGLDDLESVPVTTRHRYQSYGEETRWTIHLKFAGARAVAIGSVVNDAAKVESLLDELRRLLDGRISASAAGPAFSGAGRFAVVLQLLDADPMVRTGQIICMLMIALAIYAAPPMALFYGGLLIFGTLLDWMARRTEE